MLRLLPLFSTFLLPHVGAVGSPLGPGQLVFALGGSRSTGGVRWCPSTMGGRSSKPPPPRAADTQVLVNKPDETQVVTNSSGFHFMEFHMPSAGATALVFFLVAGLIALGAWLYRRRLRRTRRRREKKAQAQQGQAQEQAPQQRLPQLGMLPGIAAAPVEQQPMMPMAPMAPMSPPMSPLPRTCPDAYVPLSQTWPAYYWAATDRPTARSSGGPRRQPTMVSEARFEELQEQQEAEPSPPAPQAVASPRRPRRAEAIV